MTTDLETNLQIIEEFTQRLQVAVIGAEETTEKHVDWVEGPVDATIETANGPLKTLRGQIAEWRLTADQDVASAISGYDAQFADALAQFQSEFDAYLITIGFEPAVEYVAGILISRRSQTVVYGGVIYYWVGSLPYTTTGDFGTEMSWQIAPIVGGIEVPTFNFNTGGKLLRKTQSVLGLDGEWYYWNGTFPKTIPPASTLESAGGVGQNLFKISSGYPPLRPTIKILASSIGFNLNSGSFEGGATIIEREEVLVQFLTGKIYQWNGALPKVVDLFSTPDSSGGIGAGSWEEIQTSYNKVMIIESLRRSYKEAGYTLVSGSFEAGGTLTSEIDVLLYEANGNAYSYSGTLPHNVGAGSNPDAEPGMWVNRSLDRLIVYAKQFGVVGDGIVDDTTAIRSAHVYANAKNAAVSYSGITKAAIQADAEIPINTTVDFCGCKFTILNGMVDTPSYSSFTKTFVVADPAAPVETATGLFTGSLARGSRTPTKGLFNGSGYALIECDYQIPARDNIGTVNYKQSFNVIRDGQCTLPLSWDVSANAASLIVKYRKTSSHLVVSGLTLPEGGYNNLQFLSVERCNVNVDGFMLDHTNGPLVNNINRIIYCYYAADVYVTHTKGVGQPVTVTSGSYFFQADFCADLHIDFLNSTWFGWSSTGNNHLNGFYVTNSNLVRVDCHEGGHNIFVDNCRLYDRGVGYGWGGGVISVTNSVAIDCFGGVVESRDDYGGNFFGSIFVDNIQYQYPLTGSATIVDIKAGASIDTYLPETINISNISWVGTGIGSKKRILVNVYKKAGVSGSVYAPNEIKIDGVSSPMPFYFGGNFDYGNMIPRFNIFRYDLVINNVSGDVVPDKGNGINISAGGTALVYFSAINHRFLLLEASASTCLRSVEISSSSICGLHTQTANSNTPMTILNNCTLEFIASGFTGAVPIGGIGFGNNSFTRMTGCTIGYVNFDLSGVEAAIGNVFRNGSGTPPVLPATFTIDDFFLGKKSARFR